MAFGSAFGLLQKRFVPRAALAAVLAAFMFVQPAPAQAATKAEEIDSLFSGMCLAYLGDGHQIVAQAKGIGAKPLPDMIASQFLAPRKGVAWAVQGGAGLYMLGLNDQLGCRVIGPDASAAESLRTFAAGPKRRKIGEEVINGRVQHVFAVVANDAITEQPKHMVVIISASPDAKTPGVFLDAMPYGIAQQAGIVIDHWPE